MAATTDSIPTARIELLRFGRLMARELKPKGKLLTPFNVISGTIILLGAVLLTIRFTEGLGSITNHSQHHPWGLWIGINVMTGVALAGGAYILTFMVYILRLERYRPIIRVTVLNGFLASVFYAGALFFDLGRPWNVVNPIMGNSFGVSSVLFLVAWLFVLYMAAKLIEFSPAVAEWLGLERVRRRLHALTLGAVVLGITLATLHQSALGALFLMARTKVHPLWYSEFIPLLFFVSSIFAGLSMVIFEGSVSRKVFRHRIGRELQSSHEGILVGLARISSAAMFVYLCLLVLVFVHGQDWPYVGTRMGAWYLLEVVGFVMVPAALFLHGCRGGNVKLIRVAAVMALAGVLLNRLNVSIIAFKWYAPERFVPTWMEIEVTLALVCAQLWVFRWVVNRMPVLDFATEPASRKRVPAQRAAVALHRELEPWKVLVQ
ncbi:MAG: polysulfide reductase NrfD [Gemmatimonadetes bacterium]|nr:polysulfide reductase NrfD [Gemmatimonadota bacterium]